MSKYIIGNDINQFEFFCIEERIGRDNEVRLIDLFIDSLPLSEYGFVDHKKNPTSTKLSTSLGGRPAYHPSVLLKFFIYSYMNNNKLPSLRVNAFLEILNSTF